MRSFKLIAALALWLCVGVMSFAFTGSDLKSGEGYYLFNIYQSKFLSADNKLDNTNPVRFVATATGFNINGVAYTATKNGEGFYQLTRSGKYFAFEDKVVHPDAPNDENQAKYLGGGVTCQETANNTDRSHWVLINDAEYSEWTAKKKVVVASLNVDGMPKSISVVGQNISLNPDAKEGPGATAMGTRLLTSGFDVVGVSEDFNFHSELWDAAWNNGQGIHYNAMTHRGTIKADAAAIGNILAQRPVLDSDGLELFYRIDGENNIVTPSQETWVQWTDHYGYTDNGADGLIKKGYRYYLLTLADGTEIDLYTLHMDAESSAEDNAARDKQLAQLAAAIIASDNKRPVIIIGDSNCRYTRDKIKEHFIDVINADERFTCRDPWIQFGRNNTYPTYGSGSISAAENGYLKGEVVDKIFYINNTESTIRLVAETYAQDLSFVNDEGEPLCDHKPCVVTFSYHDYDPAIDDEEIVEITNEPVYLLNRATGRYLMNGGWWGSHAVVGNYPKEMYVTALPNGKYDISTKYGHITDAAYIDNNNPAEYISEFELISVSGGYKVLSYTVNGSKRALTADDPTYFNGNPIYRYATTAPLNADDQLQQWKLITKSQFEAMMAEATPDNPINVSHLIGAANLDRIDWGEHGQWSKTTGTNVTMTIGGADNDPFCNFNYSIAKKAAGTWGRASTWKLSQQLKGIPSGYYLVSCQGFVQGNTKVSFYAKNSNATETIDLLKYDDASVPSADRPTANDQASAGVAFNNNLYNNYITTPVLVTDGTLEIGVEYGASDKLVSWTCVDNFQLMYLGPTYTANLSVGADKYGTFVAPYDITLPEGVSAYSAEYKSTSVLLNPVAEGGETLAAYKPVILKNNTSELITQDYSGFNTSEVSVTDGILVGCLKADEIIPMGSYVLQTQDDVQSFYLIDTPFACSANRCYLSAPANASSSRLAIIFDEADAINNIATEAGSNTPAYNLSGLRVNSSYKGIVIKNGKKMIQ